MECGKNAPPMHPNCHCATAPHIDRQEFNKWLDEKETSQTDLSYDEWRKQGNTSLLLKLNLQSFAKRIKPLWLSPYENATVPSAVMTYANAQPKEDMYSGRMMIKECGDYRYHFIWYNEEKVVIYKRTKVRAKNSS